MEQEQGALALAPVEQQEAHVVKAKVRIELLWGHADETICFPVGPDWASKDIRQQELTITVKGRLYMAENGERFRKASGRIEVLSFDVGRVVGVSHGVHPPAKLPIVIGYTPYRGSDLPPDPVF